MRIEEHIEGVAGMAERITVEPADIKKVDHSATVDLWFLTCPGQALFWNNYVLGIYHLRHIEGGVPVKKMYESVTHEVALLALDPNKRPNPLDLQTWRHMMPINFVIQLELPNDDKAKELLALAARSVVDGFLWAEPPLSGQMEPWRTTMLKTAAHLRGEVHGQ